MRRACASLVVLVVLVGHIVDKTTGQPLTGVDVSAHGPTASHPVRTNDAGTFTLPGLAPGHYTLTLSSDDVPPQTFDVTVRAGKSQQAKFTACSTTLDYSCASALP
jgi:hypothetical protein